mgnify:FL=1|tara:strand:+ start:173 stop:610 length:438 start_codon:yes stop_codon:yes gene_type:complete
MKNILITTLIIMLTLLSACSSETGSPTEENLVRDLKIKNMKLIPEIINVVEKSNLTLNIYSDTNGSLHFHGYNIEFEISKDIINSLDITVNATGSFPIALHYSEESDDHTNHNHGANSKHAHNHGSHEDDDRGESIIGKLIVNPK